MTSLFLSKIYHLIHDIKCKIYVRKYDILKFKTKQFQLCYCIHLMDKLYSNLEITGLLT